MGSPLHYLKKKYLYHRLRKFYPTEVDILNGRQCANGQTKSVVFFTVHKCASVYTAGIMAEIAAESKLLYVDYESFAFNHSLPKEEWNRIFFNGEAAVYPDRGYLFGPIRTFTLAVPHLENYEVVLQLRDPRDVLTSLYFSHGYSHSVPDSKAGELVQEQRKKAVAKDIDQFVLDESDHFLNIYQDYIDHLYGKPNVLLLKYEEMVTSFESWLEKLTSCASLKISPELREKLLGQADFKVEKEDKKSHKRQVTPGDHKRKLKPETQEKLTRKFEDILQALDYL